VRTSKLTTDDWKSILPVPPLARRRDAVRSLDFDENDKIVRHMTSGGVRKLLYGGNAFLYHLTLTEYGDTLNWLASLDDNLLLIPSAGPSYGRAMDQAPLLRKHRFPIVMMLPCGDPRDARGLERGYREIADAIEAPLLVYLKDESNMGTDKEAGLDSVARLVEDGVCMGIKYAVVRQDPSKDLYLEALLKRVDREYVISGIGERPAIAHMRDFGLAGFTTGSGCLAPRLSLAIHALCSEGRFDEAEPLRTRFIPHEDLRDSWGPARVLHASTELSGVARAGAIPPYISELSQAQWDQLRPVAEQLVAADREAYATA
jgi:dihydrodipicolinate synthase/N-acetylneuraminate lyase